LTQGGIVVTVKDVLRRCGYKGWLSFIAGAGKIAPDSFAYTQAGIARLG
jgi:hypothetical protein